MTDKEKLRIVSGAFNVLRDISSSLPWTVEDMISDEYMVNWRVAQSIASVESQGKIWTENDFSPTDYGLDEDWKEGLVR
jgi:hypothetical protein